MNDRQVYLIEDADDIGPIFKIGSSSEPAGRIQFVALSAGAAVVHSFPSADAYAVERALHRHFDFCRAKEAPGREWFRLGPQDVDAIRRLGRTDSVGQLPESLQESTVPAMTVVRIDGDLVSKARVMCYARGDNFSEYIDSVVRDKIKDDYDAFLASHRKVAKEAAQ